MEWCHQISGEGEECRGEIGKVWNKGQVWRWECMDRCHSWDLLKGQVGWRWTGGQVDGSYAFIGLVDGVDETHSRYVGVDRKVEVDGKG